MLPFFSRHPDFILCLSTVFGNTGNKSNWHDQDLGGILSLAASDDSSAIVTGGEDGTARLCSIAKKKERVIGMLKHRREGKLNGHVVEAVGFSPSADALPLVFTAGSAGLLVVWDRNSLEPRFEVRHTNGVVSAGFCLFSPILWTCSADESACMWDSRSGTLLKKFTGHKDVVLGCCPVPMADTEGGVALVTCSDDKTCRVFQRDNADGADAGQGQGGEEKKA